MRQVSNLACASIDLPVHDKYFTFPAYTAAMKLALMIIGVLNRQTIGTQVGASFRRMREGQHWLMISQRNTERGNNLTHTLNEGRCTCPVAAHQLFSSHRVAW